MKSVIEVKNVSFGYASEAILRGVCFAVAPGDFAGIIGSNGAGKSTLLRILLGELAPQEGEVRLFEQKVEEFRQWPRIGYVPQGGGALAAGFPANVMELVCSNLYAKIGPLRLPNKAHRAQASAALEMVGMAQHKAALIGELSGGQLQRVLLARALVGEPELLLLDEPSTGVDEQTVLHLYELLEGLCKKGVTVLMVTHDLHRAADYTHRILCLERGSMVELDSVQLSHELEHRHRHP